MNLIHVLDPQTANSIAAGEVVERPASVVKELVENSLDAGASVITVEIVQGGIVSIRVTDNGCGMGPDDALLSFARHATSKIIQIEDLDSIATMGFRGEALASIAAVAKVRLETRRMQDDTAFMVVIHGGEMTDSGPSGAPTGTSISVDNLFFNVPARFKFLRKDATEAGVVTDLIERLALARPDVSFRLISNRQEVLHTPGNNDLLSTVYAVYGKKTASACLEISHAQPPLKLNGLIGRPDLSRNSRSQQSFYVNGRLIRAKSITAALDDAYQTLLMKGKYAFAVLFIDIPPNLVDVNVHPQKMEVRFWNDQEVFRTVYHAIKGVLVGQAGIAAQENQDDSTVPLPYVSQEAVHKPVAYEQPLAEPLQLSETVLTEPTPQPVKSEAADERPGPVVLQQPDIMKINDLEKARLIGQLFSTYILLELDQELLLVDQHAAHEKILFEALLKRHRLAKKKNGSFSAQQLLVPLIIEVSKREMQVLQQEQDLFSEFGFEFDLFGTSSVALRSCPDDGANRLQPERAFRLALDTFLDDLPDNEDKAEEMLFDMACKAAVKAHDTLKPEEVERLLSDLQQLDNPYQCPHGRPVIVRLTRHELEKRFKRIV